MPDNRAICLEQDAVLLTCHHNAGLRMHRDMPRIAYGSLKEQFASTSVVFGLPAVLRHNNSIADWAGRRMRQCICLLNPGGEQPPSLV